MPTKATRLHFIDIRFEDGRWAHVALRDGENRQTVHVEGLRHVVKVNHEHYTIKEGSRVGHP